MSAAATAAGYLYASGRLRRSKDGDRDQPEKPEAEAPAPAPRRKFRVAVIPERQPPAPELLERAPVRSRPAPRIEYRVRRWKPDEPGA
jgi:hypothetical protein